LQSPSGSRSRAQLRKKSWYDGSPTGGTWAVSGLFAAVVAAIALRVHRAARALLAAVWLGVCLVVPVWALLASGFGADARVLLVALLLLAVLAVGWPLVAGVRERSDRATGR
ncbi:hypothetical protein, partial [Curtobacterium sp. CT11-133]|uniref:hypothetical protein n=1 Tax=Curtobacterium sp. CT11-133 TaxID=3243014 RepID=UPI0039B0CD54